MKGIILSGGQGTRLYPATQSVSKQLLPVYDKPMIYYPLSTLMLGGVSEIAIISTPYDLPSYKRLLGTGKQWGLKIEYHEQSKPLGIAHAFIVCEKFIANESVCLILGDNIFYGNLKYHEVLNDFSEGALIFGYPVKDPERYGVLSIDGQGRILDIIEKPSNPPSNFAIPGLYVYDKTVVKRSKMLKPSARGELEITDLNKDYLKDKQLQAQILGRGIAWFDTGTSRSLQEASSFIRSVEEVQMYKISCPEEIAIRQGFIDLKGFDNLTKVMPQNEYREYLLRIRTEFENNSSIYKSISRLQP